MRQAPGDLGKMQWDAAAARSAIDNLPPKAALSIARNAFSSILERIESLNDRYYPVQGAGVERVGGNKGLLIDFDARQAGKRDVRGYPVASGAALNEHDDPVKHFDALNTEDGVGLDQDLHAIPDSADVVSLFDRRLDRIFGRR